MTTTITLDQAGRVLIPKALREELELEPGDALHLESEGEKILLRPVRGTMPLQKEDGIWVLRLGEPLRVSPEKVLQELRAERDRSNLGTPTRKRTGRRR
jgi:AbrB family looped-hinge helix DNA binding protein